MHTFVGEKITITMYTSTFHTSDFLPERPIKEIHTMHLTALMSERKPMSGNAKDLTQNKQHVCNSYE